jgi:hypothetical protein
MCGPRPPIEQRRCQQKGLIATKKNAKNCGDIGGGGE